MNLAEKGWIKLHRKVLDCWIWQEKPYDKARAWVDLLLLAMHRDKKLLIDNEVVVISRGSFMTSIVKLADRWGWSRCKAMRYLELLEREQMLNTKRTPKGTLVTIVKYEDYQIVDMSNDTALDTTHNTTVNTTDDTTNGASLVTTDDTQKKNIKNVKNDKNNIRLSKDNLCQTESVRRVVEEWNTLSEYGIKPVSRLTSGTKRYDSLIARLRKYSVDDVLKAIDNIRHSDFLQGKHNGKPWQITFDWFVLPNNFPKVLEGNYDNSENIKMLGTGNAYIDAIHNRVSEVDDW